MHVHILIHTHYTKQGQDLSNDLSLVHQANMDACLAMPAVRARCALHAGCARRYLSILLTAMISYIAKQGVG